MIHDGSLLYRRACGQGRQPTGWISLLVCLLVSTLPLSGGAAGILPGPRSHPDGVIGKPGITLEAAYSSVTGDDGYSFNDINAGSFRLTAPVAPALTLGGRITGFQQADSTFYSAAGLVRFYFGNPIVAASPTSANPDGRIGLPSAEVATGADISDAAARERRWFVDGALIWPISTRLSLGAGYVWREEKRPSDAIEAYGIIRWYTANYRAGEVFENPDGPPGSLVVHLTAGSSSNGSAGLLDLAVPLNRTATIGIGAGAAMFDLRSEMHLTARLRLSWYPH